jgi:transcriptional regulator with XRE-family HTH domain
MDLTVVSENIRKLRELKNYTQEFMADKISVTRETYGKIERGEPGLKVDTLINIASVLEVPVTKLFDFDPQIFFNHSSNTGLINSSHSTIHPIPDDFLAVINKTLSLLQEQNSVLIQLVSSKK